FISSRRRHTSLSSDWSSDVCSSDLVADDPETRDGYALIPTTNGFLQMSVRLLEHKVIARSAMKAPAGKSALESGPSVANSADMRSEERRVGKERWSRWRSSD